MKFFYNIIISSIHNIWNNKVRSFLTILGIVIGIAAFIVMLGIGRGTKKSVTDQITKLGSNLVFVRPDYRHSSSVRTQTSQNLTVEDAVYLEKNIDKVVEAAAEKRFNKQVKYFNNNVPLTITGSSAKIFSILNLPLESGRYFTENEVKDNERICVIGATTKQYLFGNMGAVGKTIKIEGLPFTIAGVLKVSGGGWNAPDEKIYVPITVAMRKFSSSRFFSKRVNMIYLKIPQYKDSAYVVQRATELLRKRHNIRPGNNDDFRIYTQEEMLATYMAITKTLNSLLISIALISLIVGGIGIMNIMLVTVTERTKEIGLRKALGATNNAILLQFLSEAVILSMLGGLIGAGLGIAASKIISQIYNWLILLDWFTISISIIFSAIVGIVFGVFPSRKAARLNPIDALRAE